MRQVLLLVSGHCVTAPRQLPIPPKSRLPSLLANVNVAIFIFPNQHYREGHPRHKVLQLLHSFLFTLQKYATKVQASPLPTFPSFHVVNIFIRLNQNLYL